tara:strand:+ start:3630 stop:4052 length:423 start_codon:yes stop_codon:yes gene_type:complete
MCCKKFIYSFFLKNCTKENTAKFKINGIYIAKIVDVYDGDTCQIVIFYNFSFKRYSLRIKNIDAPEIKSNDKTTKEKAIHVRDTVRSLILNKILYVNIENFDKYGRLLGDIILDNNDHLSTYLLELELVKPYDGGKKPQW